MDSKTLLWGGIAIVGFALIIGSYAQITALRGEISTLRTDIESLQKDINLYNEVGAMSAEDAAVFREYD